MTMPSEDEFDPTLLDLHLGHLSEAECLALQRRIASDPALATQNEALTVLFRALGGLQDEAAPADLVERVCARVAQAARPPRVVRLPKHSDQSEGWLIRVRNLGDIVAVAAMIVLAIGLGLPGLFQVRQRTQRSGCSANLARLGQGLAAYASAFNDSLPFVGWNQRTSWQPSNEPGVETLPNRKHLYPLLRIGMVPDPRLFVCPARADVPMSREQIQYHNDFIESRNLSYPYQNMAGVRPSLRDRPDLPVLADDNPLFDDGLPLFDLRRRLGLRDPASANSNAHGGTGQNLLTLGGRVRWVTTPNSGVDGDNIWTLNGVTKYTGREGPQSTADSHLLK